MAPCVPCAAFRPSAWLCSSCSGPVHQWDGPAAVEWCSFWPPSFEVSVSSDNWHKLFQVPKQLRTGMLFELRGSVEAQCSAPSPGLCSDVHLFMFAFWWLPSHNKNTETRKYIWLYIKKLITLHSFVLINEEMSKNWALKLRQAVFLWRSRFSRDIGCVHH